MFPSLGQRDLRIDKTFTSYFTATYVYKDVVYEIQLQLTSLHPTVLQSLYSSILKIPHKRVEISD